MIEDAEFRQIFQVESEEHLQTLDEGLLELEKSPSEQSVLEEVFRAAHSLKGIASMMSLAALGQVAHELESVLAQAKQAEIVLTSELIDCLCGGVDVMRQYCQEAVSGKRAEIDLEKALTSLKNKERYHVGAPEKAEDGLVATEKEAPSETSAPTEDKQESSSAKVTENSQNEAQQAAIENNNQTAENAPKRIESIRVNTDKLDRLVSQASELVVIRNRYSHRLSELETLAQSWNGCKRIIDALSEDSELRSDFDIMFRDLGKAIKSAEAGAREDNARLGFLTQGLEQEIRSLRMLPFQQVFALFPRLVRDISRSQGKEVELTIGGADTCADKAILEEIKDPLSHMLRNAIDHGIEEPAERKIVGKSEKSVLSLRAQQTPSSVIIELKDDGRGLNAEKIKAKALKKGLISEEELSLLNEQQVFNLIFRAGFSTAEIVTDLSGRGVGMDVVRTNVEKLKGNIEIESKLGKGTLFRLSFPLTLATARALIFNLESGRYAIPVDNVDRTILITRESLLSIGGVDAISLESDIIPVFSLSDVLGLTSSKEQVKTLNGSAQANEYACLIVELQGEKVGFIVSDLESEQEIVLKPHGHLLERVRNVACSTILQTGEICIVLNALDLVRSVTKRATALARAVIKDEQPITKRILLAEDSLTTRTQEKRILEAAGYEVVAAVDGADALEKIDTAEFDLLVSDVEMPRVNGLDLTKKVRKQGKYAELPIILVTSLCTDEDKRRGSEAGANAYITKGSFDHQLLLDTIRRLI